MPKLMARKVRSDSGGFGGLLAENGEKMRVGVGFWANCRVNSGETSIGHNFSNFRPNWVQKEAKWPFFDILDSLEQGLEAFEHFKNIILHILSIIERPMPLDTGPRRHNLGGVNSFIMFLL